MNNRIAVFSLVLFTIYVVVVVLKNSMESRNRESYNKYTNSLYSARSRIKSLKIVFSLHKRSKFNLSKMTCVYIHCTASIVLANSFFFGRSTPYKRKFEKLH